MFLEDVDFKNKAELLKIKELYDKSFPSDERAPFSMLVRRAKKGKGKMFSLIHDDIWCGMAYIVTYSDMAYIFYFTVAAELRGKGLGTEAIKEIIKKYDGCRVFLALEDWRERAENAEQRLRRHSFYLNCGLKDLPYKIKEADVIYAIMGVNGKIEPHEYKALMNNYLGFIMKHIVDVRIIK